MHDQSDTAAPIRLGWQLLPFVAAFAAALSAAGCVTTQATHSRLLDETQAPVTSRVIARCREGQAVRNGRCVDVKTISVNGTSVDMPRSATRLDCDESRGRLQNVNVETMQYLQQGGSDVHVALDLISRECMMREFHIATCVRAGVYDPNDVAGPLRQARAGLTACRDLARIYQRLIGHGIVRMAPPRV